jgi:hypothetical protein
MRCGGAKIGWTRARQARFAIPLLGLVVLSLLQPLTARAQTPGPIGTPTGQWREQFHWAHAVLRPGGSAIWGPLMEAYLERSLPHGQSSR